VQVARPPPRTTLGGGFVVSGKQTLKNRIPLENCYLPDSLEDQTGSRVNFHMSVVGVFRNAGSSS
jgi:hypothetical protein